MRSNNYFHFHSESETRITGTKSEKHTKGKKTLRLKTDWAAKIRSSSEIWIFGTTPATVQLLKSFIWCGSGRPRLSYEPRSDLEVGEGPFQAVRPPVGILVVSRDFSDLKSPCWRRIQFNCSNIKKKRFLAILCLLIRHQMHLILYQSQIDSPSVPIANINSISAQA